MKLQPSPVSAAATQLGLSLTKPENINAPEMLQALRDLKPEVMVVVAFGQILSEPLLEICPKRVVNVHSSLLPRWRGAAPMQRAILAGDQKTGVCLQVVVFKLDAGDVIAKREMNLTDETTLTELHDRLSEMSCDLVTDELHGYLQGKITPVAQDPGHVTIAKKLKKEEGLFDWSLSAIELSRKHRSLWPWPGVWTLHEGKVLKIRRMRVVSGENGAAQAEKAGQVVSLTAEGVVVQCGQGQIELLEVQPESRASMSVAEYLRGRPIQKGDRLG